MVRFTVYGVPVGKGSMTARYIDSRGRTFTRSPKNTRDWEQLVRQVAQQHVPEAGLLDGPLAISLRFYLPRPKSAPKRKRIWPDKRPDLDKLARAVLDGLQGVIIRDDACIVQFNELLKDYGDPPRCEIEIEELGEGAA